MHHEFILAMTQDFAYGFDESANGLPWSLKSDMAWFAETTKGRTCVTSSSSAKFLPNDGKKPYLKGRDVIVCDSKNFTLNNYRKLIKDSVESGEPLERPIFIGGPTFLAHALDAGISVKCGYVTLIPNSLVEVQGGNIRRLVADTHPLFDLLMQTKSFPVVQELAPGVYVHKIDL